MTFPHFEPNAGEVRRTTPACRGARDFCNITRRFFFHAGRITKTVRPRRLKDAKNPSNCFHGKYFLLSNCIPRAASSPVTTSARASTHSPSTLPRMSHGAILTRGLLRMRFTFPDTPMVYTCSFASFESRLADGSAANHTGVLTPSPLFLKVSRFRYLCPAKAANPIASLLAVGCKVFYAGNKKWDRHSCLSHRDSQQVQVWLVSSAFGSLPDVRHVFRKSILLFFAECPGGLEMIVVDKGVHRVMHMTVIGALQVRDAHQIERDRLRFGHIRSAHRRLISRHAIVSQLHLVAIQVVQRGHLHRLAALHHVELFKHGRATRSQLQVQRRFVHVRFVGLPVAHQRLQLFKRFRPTAGGTVWNRHNTRAQHQNTQNFRQPSHDSIPFQEMLRHKNSLANTLRLEKATARNPSSPRRALARATGSPACPSPCRVRSRRKFPWHRRQYLFALVFRKPLLPDRLRAHRSKLLRAGFSPGPNPSPGLLRTARP